MMIKIFFQLRNILLLTTLLSCIFWSVQANELKKVPKPDEDLAELNEIEWLIKQPKPSVIFTIREYDEEALRWTSERAGYYMYLLRKAHPTMPIAFLAHGDEVGSLVTNYNKDYTELHQRIQHWVKNYGVIFHVCGSMAHMLGLSEDSFPAYIDVVPYGPSQVKDYMELGYEHIELELTW